MASAGGCGCSCGCSASALSPESGKADAKSKTVFRSRRGCGSISPCGDVDELFLCLSSSVLLLRGADGGIFVDFDAVLLFLRGESEVGGDEGPGSSLVAVTSTVRSGLLLWPLLRDSWRSCRGDRDLSGRSRFRGDVTSFPDGSSLWCAVAGGASRRWGDRARSGEANLDRVLDRVLDLDRWRDRLDTSGGGDGCGGNDNTDREEGSIGPLAWIGSYSSSVLTIVSEVWARSSFLMAFGFGIQDGGEREWDVGSSCCPVAFKS
mmetsp:Transcript_9611/g.23297  ORF Transcript_9611/g.23297 Transcript_9611/m.23297 type:complete len:263 (-) Transcript_9611:774-1562(-)